MYIIDAHTDLESNYKIGREYYKKFEMEQDFNEDANLLFSRMPKEQKSIVLSNMFDKIIESRKKENENLDNLFADLIDVLEVLTPAPQINNVWNEFKEQIIEQFRV